MYVLSLEFWMRYSIDTSNHSQVREIVAVLDLDVIFYPCPRNGPNFRPKVVQMGGKQQFPYMVLYSSSQGYFSSWCQVRKGFNSSLNG